MSDDGVREFMAKLISDKTFQKLFFKDKDKTIDNSGYPIDPNEKAVLKQIKKEDIKINIRHKPDNTFSFDVG